jgi:aspartyl/glutamyl-tRNA(Asn/Gln) amidotransferase C subunit
MAFDPQELKHLMELAHITIAPDQEEQFFQKLDSIITELNKLQKLDLSGMTPRPPNVMQTIHEGVQDFSNTKGLLQNVEHPVVNNSIQIKSVLD